MLLHDDQIYRRYTVGVGVRGLAITWDRSEGFSSSFSEDRDDVCDSDNFFEG